MKCLGWHCRQNTKQLASGSECWGSFKILTSYLCVPNMRSLNSVLLCGRGLAANLPVFSLRQTTKTALFPPWFARATSPEDLPEPWAEMPNTPNLNAASDTCEQASKATSNFAVLQQSFAEDYRSGSLGGHCDCSWEDLGRSLNVSDVPRRHLRRQMFEVATELVCAPFRPFQVKPILFNAVSGSWWKVVCWSDNNVTYFLLLVHFVKHQQSFINRIFGHQELVDMLKTAGQVETVVTPTGLLTTQT